MASQQTAQCIARTADGDRCTRAADEDGFCHQHGPEDETVTDPAADEDNTDEQMREPMQQEDVTEPTAVAVEEVDTELEEVEIDDDQLEGLLAIRRRIEHAADAIIGHPLDTISEISPTEEGWMAVVDVIERRAIPDTQDILGRYELTLDEDGSIRGYQRLDRYRRGDTAAFE